MLHRPINYLLAVTLFLLAAVATAAETDRGVFWKATKEGKNVYLLGSIHLATEDFYPIRSKIEQAYSGSDAIAVEADILAAEGDSRLQQKIMMESIYQDGRTLKDELPTNLYTQLQAWMHKRNMPEAMFIRQRPAIAMISMSMIEMQAHGLNPELGIDRHFLQKAKKDGKPVLELEGVLQQFQLLNGLENPALMFQQTLEQIEDISSFLPKLTHAWKAGDINTLNRLIIQDGLRENPEYKSLYDKLFFERNAKMAEKITLNGPNYNSLFVIVGAGHLVGERSVVDFLKSSGYKLERL
ncbi:TraB/GumN family protein [Microbulbifer sp. OS29]|uniref:TraB/GumN family protein n=1 Tax=Microbulbifer okhotskensis TaxID=2926617 RepID=A0A9X2EQX2_9GAMM|nr:TraB/GumN family protein [Microbulbifer okhotskensis]MCO1334088.1 TraB/GumN family protein [Microbulbifer okhotskensis]